MTTRKYEEKVKTFLSSASADPDFIKQCFWGLKTEYDFYGKKITRWAIVGIVAACLFELLNRNLIGEIDVSGVKVARLSFLLYIMPPIVAASLLNLATLNIEQNIYLLLLKEFALQQFPALHETEIIALYLAQQGGLVGYIPDSFVKPRTITFLDLSRTGQALLVVASFIIFEFYAYTQLFVHSRHNILPSVISVCISAAILTLAVPLVLNSDTIMVT